MKKRPALRRVPSRDQRSSNQERTELERGLTAAVAMSIANIKERLEVVVRGALKKQNDQHA